MSLDAELTSREEARLRDAFLAGAEDAVPRGDCPSPERLWEASRGETTQDVTHGVIAHLASCATCAEAWRLARELDPGDALPSALPPPVPARRRGFRQAGLLAAAALLALVVGWQGRDLLAPPSEPVVRSASTGESVRSLITTELPRQDFILRWQGPEGARYDLRVLTEDLVTVLDEAQDLETAEYRIPEEALNGLAPGTKIYWHLAATLGGEPVEERTFEARIE